MTPDQRLAGIDIAEWADIEPAQLLLNPSLVVRHPPLEAAARAHRYARAVAGARYDEIAFRLAAATPTPAVGPVPLETFATARLRHDEATRRHAAGESERLRSEQIMLRHRAIDFDGDHFKYRVEDDLIDLVVTADDGTEETWTYALSHPPEVLRFQATEWDAPRLGSQRFLFDLPGMRWLPLPLLVEAGRFLRMQEWAEQLETTTLPGRYYAFVSHRWLTPTHPDPEGSQAQFVAWQLVAHLCEAIRVARLRGLHNSRLKSIVGMGIGAQGSDLAESIIVNVLRQALDDESLDRAGAEAAAIAELTHDHGVAAAAADPGLGKLRATLAEHPALAALLDRFSVWYDYSCLPQPPRTGAEDALFRQGLEALNPCQALGNTLVLLDDAEDYLTRAWCTLEGLVADLVGSIDTLVGSQRSTAAAGTVEDSFSKLLEDRPHIVWRGLLDTEVFGVQDAQTCLERLSLAATDRNDLPFIYDRLGKLGAPRKAHVDDSEIVTGTLPLPALDDRLVLAAGTGLVVGKAGPRPVASLDWTGALTLGDVERVRRQVVPSWSTRPPRAEPAGAAHLAVVAACEGEAVLVAGWVDAHLPELETMLGLGVVSTSWTASDIAPVGHLAEGALELRAVEAPVWVLVATRMRLQHDSVTATIASAVAASGRPLVRVVLDEPKDNVEVVSPPGDDDLRPYREHLVAVDPGVLGTRVGGLHRFILVEILSGRMDPGG